MASYAGLEPRFLKFSTTNIHVYKQHIEFIPILLERDVYDSPKLEVKNANFTRIWELDVDDFVLIGYNSNAAIKEIEFVK